MNPPQEVPDYDVAYMRGRKHKYAVCVFVINEGEKIRKQLLRMKEFTGVIDVVVADGGSTDGSLDNEHLELADVTACLVKRGAGKLSAQMRMALWWCMEQGYEGVIVIDGNGKDGIEAIPKFVAALEQGADHLQGSRFIRGGVHENTPMVRLLAVRLLHAPLISVASGSWHTDTTNGFRAYSRNLLLDSRVAPFRHCFDRYQLHYHLAIESSRLGFDCREIPVSRSYPASGKTPTKINGISGLLSVLGQLIQVCMGCYRR